MSETINFKKETLEGYSEALGSGAATPGGGAAAALSATQGAALVSMVCNLTVGKEKFKDHEELNQEALAKAISLQEECLGLMDKDAIAFGDMVAVYRMPKTTQEEKKAWEVAKENALKTCIAPPMELMEISLEGLALVRMVLGKSNQNAVSDLGAAASLFLSALECSWLNVVINLKDLQDKEFEKNQRSRGEECVETGRRLANELYNTVLEWLE